MEYNVCFSGGPMVDFAIEALLNEMSGKELLVSCHQKGSKELEKVLGALEKQKHYQGIHDMLSRMCQDPEVLQTVIFDQYGSHVMQTAMNSMPHLQTRSDIFQSIIDIIIKNNLLLEAVSSNRASFFMRSLILSLFGYLNDDLSKKNIPNTSISKGQNISGFARIKSSICHEIINSLINSLVIGFAELGRDEVCNKLTKATVSHTFQVLCACCIETEGFNLEFIAAILRIDDKKMFNDLASHSVSSRLLEYYVNHCEGQLRSDLISLRLKRLLKSFSKGKGPSFGASVLQAFFQGHALILQKTYNDENNVAIVANLLNCIDSYASFLANDAAIGVLNGLVNCVASTKDKTMCFNLTDRVFSAMGCGEFDESKDSIWQTLLKWDHAGLVLLSNLFRLHKDAIQPLIKYFNMLINKPDLDPLLQSLLTNKVGSRLLDVLMSTRSPIVHSQKHMFVKKYVLPRITDLALDLKIGSFIVSACWKGCLGNDAIRDSIAMRLIEIEDRLRQGNWYLWKTLKLNEFKLNTKEWHKKAEKRDKTKDLFKDIIGDLPDDAVKANLVIQQIEPQRESVEPERKKIKSKNSDLNDLLDTYLQ